MISRISEYSAAHPRPPESAAFVQHMSVWVTASLTPVLLSQNPPAGEDYAVYADLETLLNENHCDYT